MDFNSYQQKAAETAIYPVSYAITYPALGLSGEAGEVAEKVKKILRDKNGLPTPEDKIEIKKELGDVLWYIAALARDFGLSMDDIATANIEKLASRKNRGVLQGSGDNR
jgi:NTP pyrophosphatase (non-canonical NTP hydrolase)